MMAAIVVTECRLPIRRSSRLSPTSESRTLVTLIEISEIRASLGSLCSPRTESGRESVATRGIQGRAPCRERVDSSPVPATSGLVVAVTPSRTEARLRIDDRRPDRSTDRERGARYRTTRSSSCDTVRETCPHRSIPRASKHWSVSTADATRLAVNTRIELPFTARSVTDTIRACVSPHACSQAWTAVEPRLRRRLLGGLEAHSRVACARTQDVDRHQGRGVNDARSCTCATGVPPGDGPIRLPHSSATPGDTNPTEPICARPAQPCRGLPCAIRSSMQVRTHRSAARMGRDLGSSPCTRRVGTKAGRQQ